MRLLGRSFPGAILSFVTTRDTLDPKESRLIAPLAKKGRAYLGAGRWSNPILVLTGKELYADSRPPFCWKESEGIFKKFENRYFNNVQELADATQQIYLHLPSYDSWYMEKLKKKQNRRTGHSTTQNLPPNSALES